MNLSPGVGDLKPIADLPAGVARESFAANIEFDIRPPLLVAALLLALADLLISYGLRGLLRRPARGVAAVIVLLLMAPTASRADDAFVVRATSELRLAYVQTGNPEVDTESHDGLAGLNETLAQRTAVETAAPLAVDIENDELIFFPLLYWPVTNDQAPPSPQAVERINRYLETGGTILFDTRDFRRSASPVFMAARPNRRRG